ncbi:MAG: hypothetical protein PHY02_04275 [Phycisphaerae bacterium]|nr:hypothetical protein [Phycisphaerae bacterium]
MKKRTIILGFILFGLLLAGALLYGLSGRRVQIDKYSVIDRPPRIYPDYCSTVIPPNIAPLNFMVQEKGSYYFVRIYSEKGEPIEVSSRSPKISIPIGPWHKLLNANKAGRLKFDVFVRTDNQAWTRFDTITNEIANEDIDGFLIYRRMHPTHVLIRGHVGIYQRNLGNFDEKLVLDTPDRINHGHIIRCANCHTFCKNRPDKALMGVRTEGQNQYTLLIDGNSVSKVGVKFGYTSWHPSGKMAVYSIIDPRPFFRAVASEVRDLFDLDSTMVYFLVDSKTVKTLPEISRKDRLETWPVWSADGRFLYFCSAPMLWTNKTKLPPDGGYDSVRVKYDLVRISYDIERDQWGKVETVLSAQDTGRSIAMPRVSHDGRWLTFCMCKYGSFTPWRKSSDIYIVDLKTVEETGRYEYRRLDLNSDKSESWHSWSSNSRWIAFSSKREYGIFTRCYISYIDENGKTYKPLILPQKDSEFYGYCLDAFNTPELVIGPIPATGETLARIIRSSDEVPVTLPTTMATPKSGKITDSGYGEDGIRQE